MLAKILSALTIVRHAVAITLVTGAATTMVAGSLDVASGSHPTTNVTASSTSTTSTSSKNTTTDDLEALVKACLASLDSQSAECAQAIDKSGMSAPDFWAAVAMSLHEQLRHQTSEKVTGTPKPEPTKKPAQNTETHPVVTGELLGLVTACVESHERSSEPCQKALDASGLPADEFFAKVAAHFGKASEPTTKPHTSTDESLSILVKDCLVKYENAKNSTDGSAAASEACKKAIEASGLTPNDFWARFNPKTSTKPEPTKKPDTTKTTTKPVEPTTKPTPKPEATQTVSTAQLEVLVKDCFAKYLIAKETHEGGTAAAEACNRAIAASGLSGDAFFKKFGYPGAASN